MDLETFNNVYRTAWSLWIESSPAKETRSEGIGNMHNFERCFDKSRRLYERYRHEHVR